MFYVAAPPPDAPTEEAHSAGDLPGDCSRKQSSQEPSLGMKMWWGVGCLVTLFRAALR